MLTFDKDDYVSLFKSIVLSKPFTECFMKIYTQTFSFFLNEFIIYHQQIFVSFNYLKTRPMETLWKRILSQHIHIFAQRVHSKVPIYITINKLKSFAHVEGQLMSQLMPSP